MNDLRVSVGIPATPVDITRLLKDAIVARWVRDHNESSSDTRFGQPGNVGGSWSDAFIPSFASVNDAEL